MSGVLPRSHQADFATGDPAVDRVSGQAAGADRQEGAPQSNEQFRWS